ncbi:FxLYD domain-containing protein [Streptomyces sp. NPDC052042]|uniref:FxLYD domain-containing protein n=1 Tax=Streptomyces sp. NPDC052042 TaxID=3365683 RepID=UPI0037CEE8CB
MSQGFPPPGPQPQQPPQGDVPQPQQPPQWDVPQPQQPPQWGGLPPQQQPYQQQPYPPGPGWGAPVPPPKQRRTGLIVTLCVLGGLVLLGGCGALVVSVAGIGAVHEGSSSGESSEAEAPGKDAPAKEDASGEKPAEEKPAGKDNGAKEDGAKADAAADVKLSTCEVDELTKWPSVNVEIVNRGDVKSNYIVTVEFVDGSGTRVAEGMAAANNLAPGQKSMQKAQGLGESPADTKCKVTNVTRYPSAG